MTTEQLHEPAAAANQGVTVIGEALIDIVHRTDGSIDEACGGGPANIALTLGRLGRSVRLLTQLGLDDHGASLCTWLAASGVTVSADSAARTSTAIARLATDGSASYEFDLDWSVPTLSGDALLEDEPVIVHAGSIGTSLAPGRERVTRALGKARETALVTIDPNIRPSLIADAADVRAQVIDVLSLADVAKASDEDLAWLFDDDDPTRSANRVLALGPTVVFVTRGAAGAIAATKDRIVEIDPVVARVVDTVGAGDTFMGALIDGILNLGGDAPGIRAALADIGDDSLCAIGSRAAHAASITVSRAGANPPTREELDDRQE